MNQKTKDFLLGLRDLFLFLALPLYLFIWLPLFILGEIGTVNDDYGSQLGIFGIPFILALISIGYSFYIFKKKGKYYVLGFSLPMILAAGFLLFCLIGIALSGEM